MSLNDWAKNGWLKPQKPARDQIAKIFSVVDRDLEDSKQPVSADSQFNIAYNAVLQLCAILLLAEAKELREFAVELRGVVVVWLGDKHPHLSPWAK